MGQGFCTAGMGIGPAARDPVDARGPAVSEPPGNLPQPASMYGLLNVGRDVHTCMIGL